MYIKNKVNTAKVRLIVEENLQKPYFDYKGVVGLSDKSNEAATSAFTFTLSCEFPRDVN